MQPGSRLVIVAGAVGTLDKLPEAVRPRFVAAADFGLDAVTALTEEWRVSDLSGRAQAEGSPRRLNLPSMVLQVAAVRAFEAERREAALAADRLLLARCPGLNDIPASRPWFDDMSSAQTPRQAAQRLLQTVLADEIDPELHGELVQLGRVVPWARGMPVPRRALTT